MHLGMHEKGEMATIQRKEISSDIWKVLWIQKSSIGYGRLRKAQGAKSTNGERVSHCKMLCSGLSLSQLKSFRIVSSFSNIGEEDGKRRAERWGWSLDTVFLWRISLSCSRPKNRRRLDRQKRRKHLHNLQSSSEGAGQRDPQEFLSICSVCYMKHKWKFVRMSRSCIHMK